MVVKVLYYVLSIFVIVVFFLFFQEPYLLDLSKVNTEFANVEMDGVRDVEMNEERIFRVFRAKKVLRYPSKDVVEFVNMDIYEDGLVYNIKGNRAVYKDGVVRADGNVFVHRNDGMYIKTEKLSFDTKKKLISSDSPFVYGSDFLYAHGKRFSYDVDKKYLKIKDIEAVYKGNIK